MIPIGATIPHDTTSLHAGLTHGLRSLGLTDREPALEGEFPSFTALRADLTGARLTRALRFPSVTEPWQPSFFVRLVELHATPAVIESVPCQVALHAEDVVIAGARDSSGSAVLKLERAARGWIDLTIARTDLEAALLAVAREAAEKQGAEVQRVDLELTSGQPHSLAVRAVVTAKAMLFTATVTLSGRVEINDALEARLSGLRCEGDGMIGKLAAGFLRPRFAELEARSFALGRPLAGLALRGVTLRGGDALSLRGEFGAA